MKPHFFCHISLMLLSGAALGQADAAAPRDASSQAEADFARLDANGNGRLEPREVARLPRLAERFTEFDADRDGALSPDEYRTWIAARDDG